MSSGSASQAGFYYQNNVAALFLLELLELGNTLTYANLENPDLGKHIDDIILNYQDEITYYQVKWTEDEKKAFTIQNLLATGDDGADGKGEAAATTKSLWRKLADGFRSIPAGPKPAKIVLYSTRIEGTRGRPSEGIDKSLKELIDFQSDWIARGSTGPLPLSSMPTYSEFQPILKRLQDESELSDTEFEQFFGKLEFKLGRPNLAHTRQQLEFRATRLGLESTQVNALLDLVVQWSTKKIQIDRGILLSGLGINDRFIDRLSHIFKVEEPFYVENRALVEQLKTALENVTSGYIFLEGVPGAGKSTALTQYGKSNKDVQFTYYCYLPGDAAMANLRLRGGYFAKSLCISIEKNFPELNLPERYSDNYSEKLARYFEKLSQLDRQLVFIIDGLDHVHRALDSTQDPLTHQLLKECPDNVVFIVSAQYIHALPASIQAQIQAEPHRHIRLGRFGKEEVAEYTEKKGLGTGTELVKALWQKSEGIPLYLYYIVSSLDDIPSGEQIRIIEQLPALVEGKINTYHEQIFLSIGENLVAQWVLMTLAVRKEYSSVQILRTILERAVIRTQPGEIEQILKKYKHLLKERNGNTYTLFHNSFREFILRKQEALLLALREATISYYHQDIYSDEAFNNYFSLLFDARRFAEIIAATTDEWVQSAWNRYKPIGEITINLDIAWLACVEIDDIDSFVRIAFLKKQLHLVNHYLENSYTDTTFFFDGGLYAESLRTIWDGEIPLAGNIDYFNFYCLRYRQQTGNLVPKAIAGQFFKKFLLEAPREPEYPHQEIHHNFGRYLKAKALYAVPEEFINDIVDVWDWLEMEDLYSLFPFLVHQYRLDLLIELFDRAQDSGLKNVAAAWIMVGFEMARSREGDPYAGRFSFDLLPDDQKVDFAWEVINSAPGLIPVINQRSIPSDPFLNANILEDRLGHSMVQEFRNLPRFLQVYYYFFPDQAAVYDVRATSLPHYPRDLYLAISRCARLWSEKKRAIPIANISGEVRQIINALLIPKHLAEQLNRNHGVASFIKFELFRVFELAIPILEEICTTPELILAVQHFLNNHLRSGYPDYKINLAFVEAIAKRPGMEQSINDLLTAAEEMARAETNTDSLLSALNDIASAHGRLRRMEDYNRLFRELPIVACGVSYRKDYQFADVYSALKRTDTADRALMLRRIADNYRLLFTIKDAGDGRMFHICLSELIAVTARWFPGLSFEILTRDDKYIGRDEALLIVITSIVRRCEVDELPFVWALVQTTDKWDGFKSSSDHELSRIYEAFFKRIATDADNKFINDCYEEVSYLFSIEYGMPGKIQAINHILEASGREFSFLVRHQDPVRPNQPESPAPAGVPNKTDVSAKDIPRRTDAADEEMANLSEKSPGEVESYLDQLRLKRRLRNLHFEWRKLYGMVIDHFRDRFEALSPTEQSLFVQAGATLKRQLIVSLKEITTQGTISRFRIVEVFARALGESRLFISRGLPDFLTEDDNDVISKMINQVAGNVIFEHRQGRYETEGRILFALIDTISIERVENLAVLGGRYLGDNLGVEVYLKIARRLIPYNRDRAREYLKKAFEASFQVGYGEDKWYDELIPFAYECMPDEANHWFLKGFYYWHVDRAYDIPYYVYKQIVPFADRFRNPRFFEGLYSWNYNFNEKLAAGLPPSDVNTEFITSYVSSAGLQQAIFKYLIGLFEYPLVGIRQLALGALVRLYPHITVQITAFAENDLQNKEANTIEHFIVMLQSVVHNGMDIHPILRHLVPLFSIEHFNIRQSLSELIETLHTQGGQVPMDIVDLAIRANRVPLVEVPTIIKPPRAFESFVLSNYQEVVIEELNDVEAPPFNDDLYTELEADGFNIASLRKEEIETHRRINKPSGNEPFEINGPLFKAVQAGINRVFSKRIAQRVYSEEEIYWLKYLFRLYDPSSINRQLTPVPEFVNWSGKDPDPASFVAFADLDERIDEFLRRAPGRLTVFEKGEVRTNSRSGLFTNYVDVSVIFVEKGEDLGSLLTYLEGHIGYIRREKLYEPELATIFGDVSAGQKRHHLFYPFIVASDSDFRGRQGGTEAMVIPAIGDLVGGNPRLQQWVGPFDELRRQMRPSSRGCTLMIDLSAVKAYADHLKADPYLCVHINRAVDKSWVSESDMAWYPAVKLRALDLK
ncbi:MAG TPA: hypothetical protein VHE34_16255 [Puia sp.]|uniref:hypothetical protein n=1 Tax=Puia sp. TaxID=2045100 RepID=UPI0009286D72|nr:hypothetical protein [Puia sp.]MBN8852660.1 NACHT domain-containing protein [Sphingobacteriales bacterium]OJW55483.1 MAG: hypothetical protein BGO55_02785 [Sphingobacteriales bacterium 50-39]HVU96783.1 hypothetical protein [Puia sp.]